MNRKRERTTEEGTKKIYIQKLSATVGHDHVKREKKIVIIIILQYHFHYAAL